MGLLIDGQEDFLGDFFRFRGCAKEVERLAIDFGKVLSEHGLKRVSIARLQSLHQILLGYVRGQALCSSSLSSHPMLLSGLRRTSSTSAGEVLILCSAQTPRRDHGTHSPSPFQLLSHKG